MAERFVYILKSTIAPKTYTGVTSNVDKRLAEHNSGSNQFSRKFKPWIVFYTERFDNIKDALDREKYFKSCAGRKFIKRLFENDNCNPR